MAVYEIHSHAEQRRYKAHCCSKATFLQIFIVALTFIPPLLVAFRSQGFWQTVDTYREQPEVHFKHQLLVVFETSVQDGSYLTWSTYQNYNELQQKYLRIPLIKSREEDSNGDGKYDLLRFQLDMPLLDTEDIYGVKVLLMFDYKLHIMSSFTMESMAHIFHSSNRAGASLEVVGDLKLHQKTPLSHRGTDVRFNTSIIDSSSIFADTFELPKIFESYSGRNVTTYFDNRYPSWITGRGAGKPFSIIATIRYPEETLTYTPGFWQLIKFAWIQYLAILLIFLFVFDRIKVFIFQNQLVTTIVERPFHSHKD